MTKHLQLRKGHWQKWSRKHLFDWSLHAPENQVSFLREACHQSLGRPPSAHFPVRLEGTPQTDAATASYILEHSKYSRSHFTEKLGENKHAAGFADAVGDFVSAAAKRMPKWAIKSGKYIAKNMPEITKYAYAAANVTGIVAPIGTAAGWWGEEHGQRIQDISEAVKGATAPKKKTVPI